MDPSRFVTVCFVYTGVVLLATNVVVYRPGLTLATVGNGAAAVCILATGVHRYYSEEAERTPEEYGLLAAAMAMFALLVTILFLFGLSTAT